jgi:hypothetical protein
MMGIRRFGIKLSSLLASTQLFCEAILCCPSVATLLKHWAYHVLSVFTIQGGQPLVGPARRLREGGVNLENFYSTTWEYSYFAQFCAESMSV